MGRGRPTKTAGEHFAKGNYRAAKHGPLPAVADDSETLTWLADEVKRVKAALRKMKPGDAGYTQLSKALDTYLERITKIQMRVGSSAPPVAKVQKRPPTKLAQMGRPKPKP